MTNKQIYTLIAVLLAWFWGMVIMIVWHFAAPEPKVDCRQLIAGWHPDVPAKVREKCLGEQR